MQDWSHSISRDDETNREFAHHLGYAILNCGAIENLTYAYAATLNDSHFFETGLTGMRFSERKGLVMTILQESNLKSELRGRAIELWEETAEIMPIRNLVAHNPINNVEVNGTNRVLGVVDMQASSSTKIVSLDATKIANLANRASEIAHGLESCLIDIRRERTS